MARDAIRIRFRLKTSKEDVVIGECAATHCVGTPGPVNSIPVEYKSEEVDGELVRSWTMATVNGVTNFRIHLNGHRYAIGVAVEADMPPVHRVLLTEIPPVIPPLSV